MITSPSLSSRSTDLLALLPASHIELHSFDPLQIASIYQLIRSTTLSLTFFLHLALKLVTILYFVYKFNLVLLPATQKGVASLTGGFFQKKFKKFLRQ